MNGMRTLVTDRLVVQSGVPCTSSSGPVCPRGPVVVPPGEAGAAMDAQGQNRDSKSRRPRSEDIDLLDSIASLLKVDINLEESRDFAAEVIKEGSNAVQTKVKPSYPLLLA